MITKRKNPFFDYNIDYWELAQNAYAGGAMYINKALIKHIAETDVSFAERQKRAYYFNYPRRIANLITQYALSTEPKRENAPLDIIADFTKQKINVNEFMRQVSTKLNIYGVVWIMVSMPYFEGKLSLADKVSGKIRPFAEAIDPQNVTDWSIDENGDLIWAIVKTRKRYDSDPFKEAVTAERYSLYTKDYIRVFECDGETPIAEYPNTLGIVPLFRIMEVDGYAMRSKHYFEDIMRISNAILNNESEAQMNTIKQMFGVMVIPEDFANSAEKYKDEKSEKMSNIISRSTCIVESPETRGITRFISPAGVETTIIRKENQELKKEMYDIVGMALNSMSHSMQTAESKSWDFHNVSQFLANRADLLEQAENRIWEFFRLYDSSIPEVKAVYNRSFKVEDFDKQIKALLDISALPSMPLSITKQVARSAVEVLEKITPISDDVKQNIFNDIEEIEEAPKINMNF